MAKKINSSWGREIMRWGSVLLAAVVLFYGPRLVETDSTRELNEMIEEVRKAKTLTKELRGDIIAQFQRDRKFRQQHSNSVGTESIKLPVTAWFSFLILLFGLGAPFLLKWIETRKGANQNGQNG